MHKVIIDTDPGVDDAMAIAYAYAHPQIDLLALTTVFGNVSVDLATRNAQYILNVLEARDVAVARGAAVPIVQPPRPHAEFVHGLDGLGNVYPGSTPDRSAPQSTALDPAARHANLESEDAANFIIQAARDHPGEVTVVAIGPLSNVAEALRREPELPRLLKGLVIMGGTVIEPGNVSPVAEANFLNDPHAADLLLGSDWPVTVVGLDVTHRIMLYDSDLQQLARHAGAVGQLLWESSRFYVDFYVSRGAARESVVQGGERCCAMHDAAAVACLLIPDAYTLHSGAARVVCDGIAAGQLALDRTGADYALPYWQDRPPVHVCMAVDAERVKAHFLDTLIAGRSA